MALSLPDFLQTKTTTAMQMRAVLLDHALQPGVLGATDMKVVQKGTGANMSVDIGAGSAWVKGITTARQGLYHIFNDATVNVAIANNVSGNPRLDQIVAHVYDSVDGSAGQDAVVFEVIQGTPNAATTLDTRTGFGAVPNSSLLIADVLVGNGVGSIVTANIRDRRPWARGLRSYSTVTAGPTYANTANTPAGTLLRQERIEATGNPFRVGLVGGDFQHDGVNGTTYHALGTVYLDGVQQGIASAFRSSTNGFFGSAAGAVVFTPSAGSHLVQVTSVGPISAMGIYNWQTFVEESVAPNANNGST